MAYNPNSTDALANWKIVKLSKYEGGLKRSYRLDAMVEFDQMWFIFQHSLTCGPHSLLPSVLQRLNSRGIESLILILEKVLNCRICPHWSDTASQPSVFHVGEQKIVREVPNQKIMEGDQPVQSHSYAQQPLQPQTCVQEHCPGETGFPASVFQAINEMCMLLYIYISKS